MQGFLKRSTAVNVTVLIISSTDSRSGLAGATSVFVYATKAGGTPALITPIVTELDSINTPGLYALALTASHTDTLGELQLHVTAALADPTDVKWQVSTNLPGELQPVNVTQWNGGAVPAPNQTGVPIVDASYLLGTIFPTPTVAGVPNVNVKTWNDLTTLALPLVPTTAGRTLDVSATGEAGVDWANVGSPTTTVGLTGTTIATSQVVASVSGAVGSVTGAVGSVTARVTANTDQWAGGTIPAPNVTGVPLIDLKYTLGTISPATAGSVRADAVTGAVGSVTGNVGGNVVGSVGSVTARVTANTDQLAGQTVTAAAGVTFPTSVASPTNITAGTITTVTNLTNAPTSGDFTAAMKTSLNAATPALSAAGVQAIWDALTSALTTVGSVGKRIADFLTGDAFTRLGAPAGASVSADVAAVKSDTATILNDVNVGAGAIYTRIGAPAGASVSADIAAVLAKTPDSAHYTNARGDKLDNLDATVSSRLASASYTAPDNSDIAAIKAKTDNLPSDPASESLVISALSAVDADVLAVKAKTDSLTFTVSGQADVNVQYVNDTQVIGDGHTGTEWGPA